MNEPRLKIIVLALLFALLPANLFIMSFLGAAGSAFYAEIKSVNLSDSSITAVVQSNNRKVSIKYNPSTFFYKKTKPRQEDFTASIHDFRPGDVILVFSNNPESPSPIAVKIWDQRAVLCKLGLIQTEVRLAGEISDSREKAGVFILQTFDGARKKIRLTKESRVMADDIPGPLGNLKKGSKVMAVCRWRGFKEDEPEVLDVYEIMDSRTYVVVKYQEKFGSLLAKGMVQTVNTAAGTLKVTNERGESFNVTFGSYTRWIPATPRIKAPADFTGHNVLVFGKVSGQNSGNAGMIINQMAINSIFTTSVRMGEIPGSLSVLAFGELLSVDKNSITVQSGGQKIRIGVSENTEVFRNDKKIPPGALTAGERVVVKGVFRGAPSASVIISVGKVK